MDMIERGLSEEQKMMRASCRAFVDDFLNAGAYAGSEN